MSGAVSVVDFTKDKAWNHADDPRPDGVETDIDGVVIEPLVRHSDGRGNLVELLTERDGAIEPMVHTYAVTAAPGSVRAWLYHKKQKDRLHLLHGKFHIALFDIREDSPTKGNLMDFVVGIDNPVRLIIPTYVVHGVKNIGSDHAIFINFPTEIYDLKNPDKYRLEYPSKSIPFTF